MEENPAKVGEAPTLSSIAGLLDKEIDLLRGDESRGGITTWAIAGALAAVAALFLNLAAAHSLAVPIFWKWLVALSFIIYIAITWLWEPNSWPRDNADPFRFRLANHVLRKQRTPGIIMLLISLALIYGARAGADGVRHSAVVTAVVFLSLGSIAWLAVVTFSFIEFYIPGQAPTEKAWSILIPIFATTLFAVAYIVASYLAAVPGPLLAPPSLPALQAAGLAATAGLLLRLLAGQSHQDPTLHDLIRVRRDLALGRMGIEQARRATELALLGADSAARHEYEVAVIERRYRKLIEMIGNVRKLIEAAHEANQQGLTVKAQRAVARSRRKKTAAIRMSESLSRRIEKLRPTLVASAPPEALTAARSAFDAIAADMTECPTAFAALEAALSNLSGDVFRDVA